MVLAALFMFFEEWLWERLKAMMAAIGRLPLVRNLEARIADLSPGPALVVFCLPTVLILPVKLLALKLIIQGHAVLGVGTILAAKVGGMALFSRIFTLCRPALLTVAWFCRLNDRILGVLVRLHAWADAWPPWQAAKARIALVKGWLKGRGFLARQWRAALLRARRGRR